MRAVEIRHAGGPGPAGPESLIEVVTAEPAPGPDEVLIDVVAAGVNRADILQRQGHYPPPPGAPTTLGLECAGTIVGLGAEVSGWEVGDRVAALIDGGGYAERAVAPAAQLLAVPEGMDLPDAAALPEAVCTAWSNLVMVGGLTAGQVVLIHGGSGGVGTVAIQLARALGATVATTAGGPDRVAACLRLGAAIGIDHREQDVAQSIAAATAGQGADLILDVLGAGALATNLRCLATSGRLVVVGLQQGRRGTIDLGQLLAKRASVHGTTLRSRPRREKAAIVAQVAAQAWPLLEGPGAALRPVVHARIPLAEASRAHEMLAAGEVFGKVVLVT